MIKDNCNVKPYFLITIDTEGDNLWSKPSTITTKNAAYLYRFQELCEAHDFKPTYLTNYEMATSQTFIQFGKDILERKTGEIGMHLHGWNSPPLASLTKDDFKTQPYLIEYDKEVMREKIIYLTNLLEETFGIKMVSHRAGRWAFNEDYAEILHELGYKIDCSVTPFVNWKNKKGDPSKAGGSNYEYSPREAYFVDINDINSEGNSKLLEIPMTIIPTQCKFNKFVSKRCKDRSLSKKISNKLFPGVYWLRPNGKNLKELLYIVNEAINNNSKYVEFMLHSSELMPGGSPTFPTDRHIEKLYDDLKLLFGSINKAFKGATLEEFYNHAMEKY